MRRQSSAISQTQRYKSFPLPHIRYQRNQYNLLGWSGYNINQICYMRYAWTVHSSISNLLVIFNSIIFKRMLTCVPRRTTPWYIHNIVIHYMHAFHIACYIWSESNFSQKGYSDVCHRLKPMNEKCFLIELLHLTKIHFDWKIGSCKSHCISIECNHRLIRAFKQQV